MDPVTKRDFWDENPEAWAACRADVQPVEPTLRRYVAWVRGLPGKPVFVAYPATFDFLFVYWYLRRHGIESPFSFSALDIKTYAMACLGTTFRGTSKRSLPKAWFPDRPHTHVALDDAIEQGELFMNMLRTRLADRG